MNNDYILGSTIIALPVVAGFRLKDIYNESSPTMESLGIFLFL